MEKIIEFMKTYINLDMETKSLMDENCPRMFKTDFVLTLGNYVNSGVNTIDNFFRAMHKNIFNEKEQETLKLIYALMESENVYKNYETFSTILGVESQFHPCTLLEKDLELIHKNIDFVEMRKSYDNFLYTKREDNFLCLEPRGDKVKLLMFEFIEEYIKRLANLPYANIKDPYFSFSGLSSYFETAAWAFIRIIKIKPWSIGNTEMAFFVANHILQHIVPVPVIIQKKFCVEKITEKELLDMYVERVCNIWANIICEVNSI